MAYVLKFFSKMKCFVIFKQISVLTEKGAHDNELIETLMKQQDNLQKLLERNSSTKENTKKELVVTFSFMLYLLTNLLTPVLGKAHFGAENLTFAEWFNHQFHGFELWLRLT